MTPTHSVGDVPTVLAGTDPATPMPSEPSPTIPPDAGSAPTTMPAGFAVVKELGRGGMGVVYLAHQAGLNRLVALKMILGEGDRKSLIRFLAEAEAVAAIRHPNVVRVYQYGESAGRPLLALKYLPGGSLAESSASRERQRPEDYDLVSRLRRTLPESARYSRFQFPLAAGTC